MGLNVDLIVDAAVEMIGDDGLARFSMRRLGARLGVDPMAIYHHVANKSELLGLVLTRLVSNLPAPASDAPWAIRVRSWSTAYWELAAANRELVAASLVDPTIAGGASAAMHPLIAAVRDSGVPDELVDSTVFLVVDFVHGSALSTTDAAETDEPCTDQHRSWFEHGLDVIVAGVGCTVERAR